MRPSFHPRLINGPFDDPGLFIPFIFDKRAILFDLGDISALSSRDLLKITHAFVTHTHMDHFIGFDNLLRLCLGREKTLFMCGPEGFLENLEGKLAGYTWNLVRHYDNRFEIRAAEIREDRVLHKRYACRRRFAAEHAASAPFDGVVHAEPALAVSAVVLDHKIPVLAFSLTERFHVNIIKEKVHELGLEIGPWLRDFKAALYDGRAPDSVFTVTAPDGESKAWRLGDLADRIALITPGQKIAYIADAVYSHENAEKMIRLAKDADQLFIEAAFLDAEKDVALEKCHLTARQAGTVAGKAGVKQFTLFHFSPRHMHQEEMFMREAGAAYGAYAGAGNSSARLEQE